MDDNFRADVEAAIAPRPGRMTCGFGSEAPGARPCKDPTCGRHANFLFAGYCSSCAPKHNIPLVTVGSDAIVDTDEQRSPTGLRSASAL